MRKIPRRLFLLLFLAACSPFPNAKHPSPTGPLPTFVPLPTATDLADQQDATPVPINEVVTDSDTHCLLPVIAPTEPAVIPPDNTVDETTGRHFMGTVQVLDPRIYRLAVTGLVDHPLSLTYDDLRCMPKMTETVTTKCYAFADTATWSGVLISEVLKKAGVQPRAKKVNQKGADGAKNSVSLDVAMDPHNFLAYQMEGNPLPILFGFPVRSIYVGLAGMYSVKWLTSLEVI